jgi:hypothetical protein
MAALFTPQGCVEISYNNAGEPEPLGGAPGRYSSMYASVNRSHRLVNRGETLHQLNWNCNPDRSNVGLRSTYELLECSLGNA